MAKTFTGKTNVGTRKKFNDMKGTALDKTGPPQFANVSGRPGEYKGNIEGANLGPISKPMIEGVVTKIGGMEHLHNDIGESSGFITDGYLDKQGTAFGEAAKLNFLPPGMDISNQDNAEINEMPLRLLTDSSYPGDGWAPAPKDVQE